MTEYQEWYQAHTCVVTAPSRRAGAAGAAAAGGRKMAVVSNKPDASHRKLAARFFPGCPPSGSGTTPRPSPHRIWCSAHWQRWAWIRTAVYVGDSEVDVATARNAGLPLIAVSWGFRGRRALAEAGAAVMVDTAAELLALLQ